MFNYSFFSPSALALNHMIEILKAPSKRKFLWKHHISRQCSLYMSWPSSCVQAEIEEKVAHSIQYQSLSNNPQNLNFSGHRLSIEEQRLPKSDIRVWHVTSRLSDAATVVLRAGALASSALPAQQHSSISRTPVQILTCFSHLRSHHRDIQHTLRCN